MPTLQITAYVDTLRQSQKIYSRYLEPICKNWGLTRSEVDVLLFLYNNPQFDRAADIVTRRGMTKSHVSMSVASLAERNLLVRRESPADRRTICLKLTESGIHIAAEARAAQQQFFGQLYEGISQEEWDIWNAITEKVVGNIEKLNKLG